MKQKLAARPPSIARPVDILGPEAVEKAFGIRLKREQVPPIPFSEHELRVARKDGQHPVLFVDCLSKGKPLTIKFMRDNLGPKGFLGGSLIYNHSSPNQDYFSNQVPVSGWKLVTKQPEKREGMRFVGGEWDYLLQMEMLASKLEELYLDEHLPDEYGSVLDEYEKAKEGLENLKKRRNLKVLAQKAVLLQLNQRCRLTPVEEIYYLLLRDTKRSLLPELTVWSNRLTTAGDVVGVYPLPRNKALRGIVIEQRDPLFDCNTGIRFSRPPLKVH